MQGFDREETAVAPSPYHFQSTMNMFLPAQRTSYYAYLSSFARVDFFISRASRIRGMARHGGKSFAFFSTSKS